MNDEIVFGATHLASEVNGARERRLSSLPFLSSLWDIESPIIYPMLVSNRMGGFCSTYEFESKSLFCLHLLNSFLFSVSLLEVWGRTPGDNKRLSSVIIREFGRLPQIGR